MSISFRDYPDIKSALDERSLNPQVHSAFLHALRGRDRLTCLDLGTGAGASLWRLLSTDLSADLAITAVDQDRDLLEFAFRRIAIMLRARGFEVVTPTGNSIQARRGNRAIAIDFVTADFKDFNTDGEIKQFDAVIAHQVMDGLPTQPMAGRIAGWLKPRGVFYATLNYDSGTTLFPAYRDAALEQRILAIHDEAMEAQRVWDHPTGGARSGPRLYAAMLENSLDLLAYGSSDWNITPMRRAYRDQDGLCLERLLGTMRDEAAQSGGLNEAVLNIWHRDRCLEIDCRTLGLIVHQIDILGQRGA